MQHQPAVAEQRIGEGSSSHAPAVPQARPVSTPPEAGYITLQPGETLSYISALYGVSEKDLISWNGLNAPHDVRAGQRLAIRQPGVHKAPSAQAGHAAAPGGTEAAPEGVVIVASGQSLSTIARLHRVTVPQLREWNGLTSDKLRAGQSLRVQPPLARASGSIGAPAAAGQTAAHPPREPAHAPTADTPDGDGMITVQTGQSLSGIAAKYKVSKAELRQWNKLKSDQLKTGQKLRVKAPVRIHTVKEGESLGGIAAKYKVGAKALMQKNKLTNADVLPVGKELIIP
jgi:LysM repeat protein